MIVMKQNNLDEMQEQALLKIEHNGCWLAFWGLLAVMAIQMMLGVPGVQMLGEWIVFMALSLYLCIAGLRKGIWDRHLQANGKTNLVSSILAGVAVGILTSVSCREFIREPLDLVFIGVMPAMVTFVLCLAGLTVALKVYRNRRKKLDEE